MNSLTIGSWHRAYVNERAPQKRGGKVDVAGYVLPRRMLLESRDTLVVGIDQTGAYLEWVLGAF